MIGLLAGDGTKKKGVESTPSIKGLLTRDGITSCTCY